MDEYLGFYLVRVGCEFLRVLRCILVDSFFVENVKWIWN